MNNSSELFEPLNQQDKTGAVDSSRPSLTYWQDAWRRLKRNKIAVISLVVILLIFLAAIIGPFFIPYGYAEQLPEKGAWPSFEHPMGTDTLGRDMLVRVLIGARISLSIGIVAAVINLTIGVLYGGIAGYFGGRVDNVMMRIVDIIYSIPSMLYVILLMVVLKDRLNALFEFPALSVLKGTGGALVSVYIAIGLTYWVSMARIVRGEILRLKEQEYITAARTLGAGSFRILLRHLIPNCMGAIIVTATLQIPDAIFVESFLSFVGLGVDAPMASWGSLASGAVGSIRSYFYLLLFPSLAISITILAFNLFGDGLRDAMDPRMRK